MNMYIILETQKSNGGSISIVPPSSYSDQNTAEQKFHEALSAAAVSTVNVHTVVMLNEYGERLKGETYIHGNQA